MKLLVQFQHLASRDFFAIVLFQQKVTQGGDLFVGSTLAGEARGGLLQEGAQFVEVEQSVRLQHTREEALVCRGGEKSLGGETVQSLTERRAAHFELRREFDLVDPFARLK